MTYGTNETFFRGTHSFGPTTLLGVYRYPNNEFNKYHMWTIYINPENIRKTFGITSLSRFTSTDMPKSYFFNCLT